MCYNGTSFLEMNHKLRYACGIDLIVKRYNPKPTDCCFIKTKLFYRMGQGIEKTWKCISEGTENEIDGLIFTPVNKPFKFGRDYFLLKWKQEHTVDFLVEIKGKTVYLKYKGPIKLIKGLEIILKEIPNIVNIDIGSKPNSPERQAEIEYMMKNHGVRALKQQLKQR
jgi:hypothetical protein